MRYFAVVSALYLLSQYCVVVVKLRGWIGLGIYLAVDAVMVGALYGISRIV